MGTRGPVPRSAEMTRRLGNPGKRPIPEPLEVASTPPQTTPPDGLGAEGSALWASVACLPWVSGSDSALLLRMCRLADMIRALDDDIARDGYTYMSGGRVYVNPGLAQRADAERRLGIWMSAFGLSPADRMRLGIAEVKAQSKFDELLARRDARNA